MSPSLCVQFPLGSLFEFKPLQTDLVNLRLLAIRDCEESYFIQSTSFCLRDSTLLQQKNIPTHGCTGHSRRSVFAITKRTFSSGLVLTFENSESLQRWLNKAFAFPPEFTRTFWAPRSVTHQSQSNQRGVISWQILYSRSCQSRLRSSDLLFKAPFSPEYNLGPVLAQPPDPLAPVSPGSWASAVWTAFWGVPASFPTWERRRHAPTRPPARCPLRSAARMDRASPELPRALCSGQGSGTRPCYQPDVPPSASPVELT